MLQLAELHARTPGRAGQSRVQVLGGRDQLLAAQNNVEEMARIIGVDSLAFLTMNGLYRAMGLPGRNAENPQYCDACFSGEYPISPTDHSGNISSDQLSFLTQLA